MSLIVNNWNYYIGWTTDEKETLEEILLSTIEAEVFKLERKATIVMLGCNHGNVARTLVNQLIRYRPKIIGVDTCQEALRKAIQVEEQVKHRARISYQYCDARLMGFQPEYQDLADIVTLNFLPSNVPKQDQIILFRSAANLLKPKGRLIFVDPDPNAVYDAITEENTIPQSDSSNTYRSLIDQYGNPLSSIKDLNKNTIIKIHLLKEEGDIIIYNDYRTLDLYQQAIYQAGLKVDKLQRFKLARNKSKNPNYFFCVCSKR